MLPEGSTRPLGYELSFSADVQSETPNDPPVTLETLAGLFPEDSDERVDITLNLSLNEYVALASCIDVGRDIAYGSSSLYIWWIWSRAVKTVDYCAITEDCIETSEGVQNALNQYLSNRGLTVVPDDNPQILESVLDSGCDPDIVFGQVTAVWDVINQTTIDFLEIMNAATNPAEALAEAISAIPIIGQLPADEIINFVDKFSEWTLDAYNAFYTASLRNEIRCDLFCLAMDNEGCTLSTAEIIDYFEQKVGALSQVRVETLEDFINFIIELPTNVAILFVCGMALAQLYIVSLLEQFLGFSSINAYIAFAQLGDPSDDWTELCEDCPQTWTHEWELGAGEHPFTILEGSQQADYVQGVLNGGLGLYSQQLTINFGQSINITSVEVDSWMSQLRPAGSPEGTFFEGTPPTFTTVLYTYEQGAINTIETHTWIGDTNTEGLRFRLVSGETGNNRQYRIAISGIGTDPF